MAPLVLAALKFIGSAIAAKAVDSAVPKSSVVPVGEPPAQEQDMDLNSLLGKAQASHESQTPKLQLQNRLPRTY